MKTKKEVLALLVALGSTKEGAANSLVSLGIKGDRKRCKTCPIAQYLVSLGVNIAFLIGQTAIVGATSGMIGLGESEAYLGGKDQYWYPLHTYPQLTGVRDFILAFDDGKHPQCEVS